MMPQNKTLSLVGMLLALMTVATTTAVQFTVSTKTSDDGETDSDGEIFFLVDGSYTSKKDHHKGSDVDEVDTKTYTTNSNPTKLKLCIQGSDSWTYVYITVNSISIFSSSSGHRLDDDSCREYNIPSSVFPVATGYSRVVATTGGGKNDARNDPVDIFFLVSNSVVSSAEFFNKADKNEQFDQTYQFYNNVKPDEVRFCLNGETSDKWKLKTLVVNGQNIDADENLEDKNKCREYSIPDPFSYPTQSPTTRKPTIQPTNAPSPSQPPSQPTNVPTNIPSGSPTTPPTHAPTNTPTLVPTLFKCRCALTWGDDRSTSCSFNIGCPLQPCDGDSQGPWCRVRNSPCAGEQTTLSGKWAYCDPLETWPPTIVPTSSSPTTSPTTSTPSSSPTTSSPTTSPTTSPSTTMPTVVSFTSSSSDGSNDVVLLLVAVLVGIFVIAICVFFCYLGYSRWQRNKERDSVVGRGGLQTLCNTVADGVDYGPVYDFKSNLGHDPAAEPDASYGYGCPYSVVPLENAYEAVDYDYTTDTSLRK